MPFDIELPATAPASISFLFDRCACSPHQCFFRIDHSWRKYPRHAWVWLFAIRCAQCYRYVRSASVLVHDGCDPSVRWKWGQVVTSPQEIGIATAASILHALAIHYKADGIVQLERATAKKCLHAQGALEEHLGHADISWPSPFPIARCHRLYSEWQAREEYWLRWRCRFLAAKSQPAPTSTEHLGRNHRVRERT